MSTIAERVMEAREANRMDKAALQRAVRPLRLSHSALSQIESGKSKSMRAETALAIARATGFRVEYLVLNQLPKHSDLVVASDTERQQLNMVVNDAHIRENFSKRLDAALAESARVPENPRRWRSWMANRYDVSQEAVRKWLSGMSIPEMSKLVAIATDLNRSVEYLLTGRSSDAAYMAPELSPDEIDLVANCRAAPLYGKALARNVVATETTSSVSCHAKRKGNLAAALAANIKVLIDERGWSQRELAKRSGVSQSGIGYVLRYKDAGDRHAGLDTVEALARAFEVEPSSLLAHPLKHARKRPVNAH